MARFLQFDNVSFAYPGMTDSLLSHVTAFFPEGEWTGIVGANGAGKTTLLKIASGALRPTDGSVRQIGTAQYAVQRTDAPPADWDDFMNCWDASAMDWRRCLGISDDWADRWDSLSHGERKRVQIAIALWHAPDVLALDEPTNHLDMRTKDVLKEAILAFDGTVIVVSHDRDFLDGLVGKVYEFGGGQVREHLGGIYDFLQKKDIESLDQLHTAGSPSTHTPTAATPEKAEPSEGKLSYEERKEQARLRRKAEKQVEECENQVMKLEAEKAELEAQLATPEGASNAQLFEAYADLQRRLKEAEEAWEKAIENSL